MKSPKIHTLSINMDLSEDYTSCRCHCKTTVTDQHVLCALLASAVISIAHDHSRDPHAFAEALTDTIMTFIGTPGFIKPDQKLS